MMYKTDILDDFHNAPHGGTMYHLRTPHIWTYMDKQAEVTCGVCTPQIWYGRRYTINLWGYVMDNATRYYGRAPHNLWGATHK